jgi:sugar phosphate isomerase/epimerase
VPDAALERIVEVGVEVNARYALAIGTDPDLARTADRFGRLCERAAAGGLGLGLEFMRFTEVRTLADALGVVRAAGHPAGGVLIDMLHLVRSGGRPEDLAGIDPDLLAYAQLCDAPAAPPGEALGQLVNEALVGRVLPGDGALPVAEILAHLPAGRPLSCEIMSSALQERHPDPVARAKVVADATRAFLARVAG